MHYHPMQSNLKEDIDKRILEKKQAILKLEEELKVLAGLERIPVVLERPKYDKLAKNKRNTMDVIMNAKLNINSTNENSLEMYLLTCLNNNLLITLSKYYKLSKININYLYIKG